MRFVGRMVVVLFAAGALLLVGRPGGAAGFSARCDSASAQRSSPRHYPRASRMPPDRRRRLSRLAPDPATPRPTAPPVSVPQRRAVPAAPGWVQNLYRQYGETAGNL